MDQVFKKLDQFLFSKVDLIKTHPEYLKIIEKLSSLEDDYKVIVNQTISFALILSPLIFVVVIFLQNSTLKSERDTKFEILQLGQDLIEQYQEINRASQGLTSATPVTDQMTLKSSLDNIAKSSSIDTNSLQVINFEPQKTGPTLQLIQVELSFRKLNLNQFKDLLRGMEANLKARIKNAEINRDQNGGAISGQLTLILLGKILGS